MRAAPAMTSLVVLTSLALAGCVGTGPTPGAAAAETDSSDGEPSPGNLTIEVVDLEAEWVPPAHIRVIAIVNGSLTEDGEPVGREPVRGVGTLLTSPWGGSGATQPIEGREDNFYVRTRPDGNFSTLGGSPHYFSPYPPPVAQPHCTGSQFQVWGVAGRNDPVPYAEDETDW